MQIRIKPQSQDDILGWVDFHLIWISISFVITNKNLSVCTRAALGNIKESRTLDIVSMHERIQSIEYFGHCLHRINSVIEIEFNHHSQRWFSSSSFTWV